jgi:hypothetical protein
MAVQAIIGGVEIQNDLARSPRLGLHEQTHMNRSTTRASIAPGSWPIRRYRIGSVRLSSRRFSVLLPATDAQSDRLAQSLPASTAITGS